MINTINSDANAHVQRAIDHAIANGSEIGLQVAAYLNGQLVIDAWGGLADETTGRMVDGDTLFNVYSVTKAVAATALHILADRGFIDYNAPVSRYWPEYAANGKQNTTVRHVLTHRACIPQMPPGVTPELMCDWDWMTREIAALEPLADPGTKTLYLSMTFGWIIGELVRRCDPQGRSFSQFVQQEIAYPLGIPDLWIGISDEVEHRVAKLTNAINPVPPEYLPPLFTASMPPQVDLVPEVFERPDVRRAAVAGVGGIFTARSEARFWAMLAQGGELDGVRILSRELAASLNTPRVHSDEPDPVMFNIPLPLSIGGYWLGGEHPPVCSPASPRAICHPGQGGSIGWADPDQKLAVAICHNRMFNSSSREDDTILPIANAVRAALKL
ncbi:serine hydrolase domain-containing protein [Pseudomonas sp. BF-R-19]|uniref:serine hydrolase domain-containing protein n=1 Tax=Pseudomonas sp. BF-R-19 TaxID=2832397 RepID=UPI001CBE78C8|nr:serine hydrolase domain-containing protein [Pseudomonas sp. BF-R-19]